MSHEEHDRVLAELQRSAGNCVERARRLLTIGGVWAVAVVEDAERLAGVIDFYAREEAHHRRYLASGGAACDPGDVIR